MAKETKTQDSSNLVFVNPDKKRRAEDIYLILTDKNPKEPVQLEQKIHLKEKFAELMSDAEVSLKDKDASVLFIYKTLAGATRTPEQHARIKKQGNISKGKAAKEEADDSDDDDDEDDDD